MKHTERDTHRERQRERKRKRAQVVLCCLIGRYLGGHLLLGTSLPSQSRRAPARPHFGTGLLIFRRGLMLSRLRDTYVKTKVDCYIQKWLSNIRNAFSLIRY